MGMIGMLILMGIVVNNGIVLVDRINQLVIQGDDLYKAVITGCLSRARPILMTVATTVLGLIPLAYGSTRIGGDGPPLLPHGNCHHWRLNIFNNNQFSTRAYCLCVIAKTSL